MSFFTGSDIEATGGRIARASGLNIIYGEPDGALHTLAEMVIWTAPRKRRFEYAATMRGVAVPNADGLAADEPRGDGILDRWKYVRVIIRALGGEAELTRVSDKFMNALDTELGALDERGRAGAWRILSDSDGGGDDAAEGVAEEHFILGLRFPIIRQTFEASTNFTILTPGTLDATGKLLVNGPTNAAPEEVVLP